MRRGPAAALLLALTVAGACGGDSSSGFETAVEECEADDTYAVVGDDGRTLTIDSEGDESAGLPFEDVECILTELDVTDAVRSKIGDTRAMDGRQEAEWSGYSASWSYHPDDGVSMVIEESS